VTAVVVKPIQLSMAHNGERSEHFNEHFAEVAAHLSPDSSPLITAAFRQRRFCGDHRWTSGRLKCHRVASVFEVVG
jgi:hypothetical protein